MDYCWYRQEWKNALLLTLCGKIGVRTVIGRKKVKSFATCEVEANPVLSMESIQ